MHINARKRKMIKKERMSIHDQSINVNIHFGADISQEVWNFFFKMYERTYFKRNGTRGYLNKTFFDLISISMRDQICMAVKKDQRLIGCALYFLIKINYMAGTGEALMNMSFCILSFAVTKGSKLH